jgi:hypothetical protein
MPPKTNQIKSNQVEISKQNAVLEKAGKQNSVLEKAGKQNTVLEKGSKQSSVLEKADKLNTVLEKASKQNSVLEKAGKSNTVLEKASKPRTVPKKAVDQNTMLEVTDRENPKNAEELPSEKYSEDGHVQITKLSTKQLNQLSRLMTKPPTEGNKPRQLNEPVDAHPDRREVPNNEQREEVEEHSAVGESIKKKKERSHIIGQDLYEAILAYKVAIKKNVENPPIPKGFDKKKFRNLTYSFSLKSSDSGPWPSGDVLMKYSKNKNGEPTSLKLFVPENEVDSIVDV